MPSARVVSARFPSGRPRHTEGPREETSLLAFLTVLLRHRATLAVSSAAGLVIFGLYAATEARLYLSVATFVVQSRATRPQIPDLRAQFGISPGQGSDLSHSAMFYTELATTRSILRSVAAREYSIATDTGTLRGNLASFYAADERRPKVAMAKTVDRLRGNVSASTSPRADIVALHVRSPDPQLARQIASNIVAELEAYSMNRWRAQAVAERAFVESRLADAEARLNLSEEQLSTFRQINREYRNSPQLRLEDDRLSRNVRMRQQVYTNLVSAFEEARIEEMRNVAPLAIVEPAERPVSPDTGTAARRTLLGLAVGLFAGILAAFLKERIEEKRAGGTRAFAEYSALTSQLAGDVKRVLKPSAVSPGNS